MHSTSRKTTIDVFETWCPLSMIHIIQQKKMLIKNMVNDRRICIVGFTKPHTHTIEHITASQKWYNLIYEHAVGFENSFDLKSPFLHIEYVRRITKLLLITGRCNKTNFQIYTYFAKAKIYNIVSTSIISSDEKLNAHRKVNVRT